MLGKNNCENGNGNLVSLNNSCVVWLPLNGNLVNYGKSDLTFSKYNTGNFSKATGNIYLGCFESINYTNGGFISNKAITLGNNQSFFAWVNFTSLNSDSRLGAGIGGQHRNASNTGMGLNIRYVSSTTGYVTVSTGTGSSRTYNTYYGKTLLSSGSWYHLGYTYDGTTITLYVNGQVDGTFTVSGLNNPADYVNIFTWSFSTTSGNALNQSYNLCGKLQDVRIYNKTLNPKEALSIYNYRPNKKINTKQVRYIRCGGNGSSANTSTHFVEIQVYDELGNNVALNKTVTSITGSTSNIGYITNGSLTQSQYTDCAGNNLIQIDLGAIYNIQYIRVYHYYDNRVYYNVTCYISADGTDFELIYDSEQNIYGRYIEHSSGPDVIVVQGK